MLVLNLVLVQVLALVLSVTLVTVLALTLAMIDRVSESDTRDRLSMFARIRVNRIGIGIFVDVFLIQDQD